MAEMTPSSESEVKQSNVLSRNKEKPPKGLSESELDFLADITPTNSHPSTVKTTSRDSKKEKTSSGDTVKK